MPQYSDRTQTEDSGGQGFVTIPAIGQPPLSIPPRAIIITGPGNLVVQLPDGSDNIASPIAVTASPSPLPYGAVRFATGNTCTAIGLR